MWFKSIFWQKFIKNINQYIQHTPTILERKFNKPWIFTRKMILKTTFSWVSWKLFCKRFHWCTTHEITFVNLFELTSGKVSTILCMMKARTTTTHLQYRVCLLVCLYRYLRTAVRETCVAFDVYFLCESYQRTGLRRIRLCVSDPVPCCLVLRPLRVRS